MKIPLIDLARRFATTAPRASHAVLEVLESGRYIAGENCGAFEREFARYVGAAYAVGVGNGTDAIEIVLRALGVGAGDEVITTPFTFFATAEAIAAVGAVPVFADVRPDTCNLNENRVEEKITSRTKAILPVHLFGLPAEMDVLHRVAKRHGLFLIEDACQAAGAEYMGKRAGALGSDAACFSFFPTKNLSCAGDGGMITTNSEELACICRAIASHGSGGTGSRAETLLKERKTGGEEQVKPQSAEIIAEPPPQSAENNANILSQLVLGDPVEIPHETRDQSAGAIQNPPEGHSAVGEAEKRLGAPESEAPQKYYHYLVGRNSRLDEIQAALLRIRLTSLEENTERRRQIARFYGDALRSLPLELPVCPAHAKHAYHLYVVQSDRREQLAERLGQSGVATGVYYPVPLHLQKAFAGLGGKPGDCPVAERLAERTLALPLFPELTREEMEYIVESVRGAAE